MIEKPEKGDRVIINNPSRLTERYRNLKGVVKHASGPLIMVRFADRPEMAFYRHEIEPAPPERKPQTQGQIAARVIQRLMSDMVKNRAYEFDGKPIYDSLTTQHIQATLEEFKQRNQFGEKDE